MSDRSIQATPSGVRQAKIALTEMQLTQVELAEIRLGISRQTVNKFFNGKSVDRVLFVKICETLKLDWQIISGLIKSQRTYEITIDNNIDASSIDILVQIIRDYIRPKILEKCSKMRVLAMEQPMSLGEIYTNVNILEKITARRQLSLIQMMKDSSTEDFERIGLGMIKDKKVPGIQAVEQFEKLMILGKPGAGKTTFLKYLSLQCIDGSFQSHRIPIFVTLKEFSETLGRPSLAEYIHQFIASCIKDPIILAALEEIFYSGRILILLDGLDEVRENDTSRVLQQIKEFTERYFLNQYVITCRIAAREYIFENFTEVEIADFDKQQIDNFSGKWFRAKQDEIKAKNFLRELKNNPPIEELATSPLLLTLLCLVFEDSGDFPPNHAELYAAGIDVLLKRWDATRNIRRDQAYKNLSLKRKEDMLSQIAWRTFVSESYFFKKNDLELRIRQFIENLSGASNDEQNLELDSEAILKSIEAQHGLFVERARGIYSFSHLTFHEYFAAREIKEKLLFSSISRHVSKKHWREVILLAVSMMPDADLMIQELKKSSDKLVAEEPIFQEFLSWAKEKSQNVKPISKTSAAIRAYYLWLGLGLSIERVRVLAHNLDRNLALDPARLNSCLSLDHNLSLSIALAIKRSQNFTSALERVHARSLEKALYLVKELKLSEDFLRHLEKLTGDLPCSENEDHLGKWWIENGQNWAEKLRYISIKYYNIGHNWQLNDDQFKKLHSYFTANQLLLDCLNSDCVITRSVREEIEDTLLLPIAEIERRKLAKLSETPSPS